jgi:hypothetical protein
MPIVGRLCAGLLAVGLVAWVGCELPASACECGWGGPFLICGEYWLQATGNTVVGNIDNPRQHGPIQRLPLNELRNRLAAALGQQAITGGRVRVVFRGEVRAGEAFTYPLGSRLVFGLEPNALGWVITVKERGRDEDLSRLTPPFHFVPNPRDVEGWHFRNSDNTGPNESGEKNVNAPGEVRDFIFSPEVGRSIDGPGAGRAPTPEEIDAVQRFGKGTLTILDYRLDNLVPGTRASFNWMRFEVDAAWPEGVPRTPAPAP